MALYKDRGVVVSGFRLGEADKILTLVSEGRGVLRAVAKGVRKTTSRFGGRLEPLAHVGLLVHEGRSLDIISGVDTISSWPALRATPDRLGTGFALAEATVRASHEGQPTPLLYRLLVAGLTGLDRFPPDDPVPPLFLTVCLLRLLDVAGFGFAADSCAACGSSDVSDRVGLGEGGALCSRCYGSGTGSFRVRPGTIALLAGLRQGRVVDTALAAGHPPQAADAAALVRRFVEYHLEIRLKAPAISAHL